MINKTLFEGKPYALTIADLLSRIEACRAANTGAGKTITLHPNGFLQLVLDDVDDTREGKRNSQYQLHIWDKDIAANRSGVRDARFEVHDHAFAIDSHILMGRIMNSSYEVEPAKPEDYEDEQFFRGDGSGNITATGETVWSNMYQADVMAEGLEYSVPKGQFHSSKSMADFSATVIAKSDIDPEYKSKVVGPADFQNEKGEAKLEVDRSIDQAMAWKTVDKVVEHLQANAN